MKNLSLLLLVSVILCGVASAAIIDCGTAAFSYAQWSTQFAGVGNGCAIGDKISNFVSVGNSIPTDTALQFGTNGSLFTVNFIATLIGGFTNNFNESYTISIDPTKPPASVNLTWISAIAAGMQDSNGNGNAVFSTSVSFSGGSSSGVPNATNVNGVITPVILSVSVS